MDHGSALPQLFDELSNGLPPSITLFRLWGIDARKRRGLICVELLSYEFVDLVPQPLDRPDSVLWIAATHEQPTGMSRTNANRGASRENMRLVEHELGDPRVFRPCR